SLGVSSADDFPELLADALGDSSDEDAGLDFEEPASQLAPERRACSLHNDDDQNGTPSSPDAAGGHSRSSSYASPRSDSSGGAALATEGPLAARALGGAK